jgi:hypothetical protein
MLQDYLLLPRTPFTNCTTKLLQHLKVTSSNDGFPLWQKPDQYGSFSTLKIQFLWLYGTKELFSIPPHQLQQCCMVLFYALLFFCKIKVMKPSFATCHDTVTKVATFKNTLFQQL